MSYTLIENQNSHLPICRISASKLASTYASLLLCLVAQPLFVIEHQLLRPLQTFTSYLRVAELPAAHDSTMQRQALPDGPVPLSTQDLACFRSRGAFQAGMTLLPRRSCSSRRSGISGMAFLTISGGADPR